jgi:ABC-2 type transport system ATP-binding protein
MAPVLEFHSVSKLYRSFFTRKDRWALRDFSVKVERGEIVGFLGPNGAGKTTAIHLSLGLAQSTTGHGTLLGHKFGDVAARRKVGFLSESPAFYHQSARAVLKFCGGLNGVREPELSRRTTDLLGAIGLLSDANRNISKFSRGMLQRIGFAQALINDPELLILDEPTSALDPISRLQVREVLLAERNRGKSVFLSSHQLSEVELICDRVVFVQEGRVIASGRTYEMLQTSDQYEIIASRLTSALAPTLNVHHDSDRSIFTVTKSEQRAAIEHIWNAGGTLISVTPKTRSLEQLFVDLMKTPRSRDQEAQ